MEVSNFDPVRWGAELGELMPEDLRRPIAVEVFRRAVEGLNGLHSGTSDEFANVEGAFGLLLDLEGAVNMPSDPADTAVEAARTGDEAYLKEVYDAGFNLNRPNREGEFPFIAAVRERQWEVFEFLLQTDCDPTVSNGQGEYPHSVTDSRSYRFALESYGRNWTTWNLGAPLRNAVRNGTVEEVQGLLDQGAPVNQYDALGETALHMAARRGDVAVMSAVLRLLYNPDLDAISVRGGETPVHIAFEVDAWGCVSLLVQEGATLTIPDAYGRTLRDLLLFRWQERARLLEVAQVEERERPAIYFPATPDQEEEYVLPTFSPASSIFASDDVFPAPFVGEDDVVPPSWEPTPIRPSQGRRGRVLDDSAVVATPSPRRSPFRRLGVARGFPPRSLARPLFRSPSQGSPSQGSPSSHSGSQCIKKARLSSDAVDSRTGESTENSCEATQLLTPIFEGNEREHQDPVLTPLATREGTSGVGKSSPEY